MRIIEINALDNGAHNNQTIYGANPATFPVPEGWAILPAGLDTPNFPFGDITVDDSTPPVVTSWTALPIPEPEPEPDPEPTVEDRLDELEAALAQTDETAIELYEANEEQTQINAAQDEALIEIYEMLEG